MKEKHSESDADGGVGHVELGHLHQFDGSALKFSSTEPFPKHFYGGFVFAEHLQKVGHGLLFNLIDGSCHHRSTGDQSDGCGLKSIAFGESPQHVKKNADGDHGENDKEDHSLCGFADSANIPNAAPGFSV